MAEVRYPSILAPSSPPSRRVLVATGDTLGPKMAGPAIRAVHMARALAAEHEVRLLTSATCDLTPDGFAAAHGGRDELEDALRWADVAVFQGWVLADTDALRMDTVLVVDVYDPMHLEQLEQGHEAGGPDERQAAIAGASALLHAQLLRGDFFLCASEKQRDFWLGHLAAAGRINRATYDDDPTLRRLVDVVPFGIEERPPPPGPTIKGTFPGVGTDDPVILWGGGIYNWFDPMVLVEAVDRLRARHPDVRLVFMGGAHPNPEVPAMRVAAETRALADRLALTGSHVLFNDDWVPYDERHRFLLGADVGVSTHLDHVETAFSFRTRVLDYWWAGLPVVVTGGDAIGELVERHGLGLTVPPGDVDALVNALDRVLGDAAFADECRAKVRELVPSLGWSHALAPLVRFCAAPSRAPDLVDPALGPSLAWRLGGAETEIPRRRTGVSGRARQARAAWREGGPSAVAAVVRRRFSRGR